MLGAQRAGQHRPASCAASAQTRDGRLALPTPQDRICDPAAGTGGFLFTAYNYVLDKCEKELNRDEKRAVRDELVEGMELSPKVGRMCAMNLSLHGIGGDKVVVHSGHDSLAAPWSKEYTMILANPPFGKSQSLLFVNEEGDTEKDDQVIVREDFWTSTSNKQLNFVPSLTGGGGHDENDAEQGVGGSAANVRVHGRNSDAGIGPDAHRRSPSSGLGSPLRRLDCHPSFTLLWGTSLWGAGSEPDGLLEGTPDEALPRVPGPTSRGARVRWYDATGSRDAPRPPADVGLEV